MVDQMPATARSAVRLGPRDWRASYARKLLVTDVLCLVWVVFGAQIFWLGLGSDLRVFDRFPQLSTVNYTAVSVAFILLWLAFLAIFGTRRPNIVGVGSEEYKQVTGASVMLFGLIAIVAYVGQIALARGFVLLAFPIGTLVLLASRWLWRQWLIAQRQNGGYSSRVVLLGSRRSVEQLAQELMLQPSSGLQVAAVCLPTSQVERFYLSSSVPTFGGFDNVQAVMETVDADTVVIASADELTAARVRRISWTLEPGRQHLIVAPSLTDIGGPRIHTRPVAGLPLIHVETPRYEGSKLFAKRAFDLIGSGLLILLLSPVLAVVAMCVRLSTPGPLLFRQQRIGLNGSTFDMLKFRSMVVDAEARLAELEKQQRDAGNAVLFKMKDDPRITPIGRFLRRYSIDELPQLFNVFAGSMSLVGPRPPLEKEVAQYEDHIHRRFLVKPGITGLWQVGGRSNLSWEESVRLDLFYVENWSIAGDVVILWRTFRAILGREGAY